MDLIHLTGQNDEITLSGVLSFDTAPQALALVNQYLAKNKVNPQKSIIINLSGISRSDSSGLALLSELMREAKKAHLSLSIKNIPKKLLDLAKLSGLESLFPLL